MIDKITKIQNGMKSLMWGCTRHSETETLFSVGHKSYPRQTHYFIVSDDFKVSLVSEESKYVFVKQCGSTHEVVEEVKLLLKEWFPAKGVVK